MSRLAYLLLAFVTSVAAQTQSPTSALDKAYEEARAAYLALQEAQKRRDEGIAPESGERQGTASGGTRPTEAYLGRQAQLEREVELARRRYEEALKRLSPDEREVIVARIEMNLDYKEVAESLGRPSPDAARVAVGRALVRLAQEMRRERTR